MERAGKVGGLKHASNIAVESCIRYGGALRVVARIEDRSAIRAFLHPSLSIARLSKGDTGVGRAGHPLRPA